MRITPSGTSSKHRLRTNILVFVSLLAFSINPILTPTTHALNFNPAAVTDTESYVHAIKGPIRTTDSEYVLFRGDAGFTVKDKKGVIFSFFGDTWTQKATDANLYRLIQQNGVKMPRNTATITRPNGVVSTPRSSAELAASRSFFEVPLAKQLPDGANFFWPISAQVRYSAGKEYILVYLSQVYSPNKPADGSDPVFNFKAVNTMLAIVDVGKNSKLTIRRYAQTPTRFLKDTTTVGDSIYIQWGTGMTTDSKYTYVFGARSVKRPYVFGRDYYVSRVLKGYEKNSKMYRYWTTTGWSKSRTNIKLIIDGAAGVGGSISITRNAQGYSFIFKHAEFLGKRIMEARALRPEGPWTTDTLYKDVPAYDQTTGICNYAAYRSPFTINGSPIETVNTNNILPIQQWNGWTVDSYGNQALTTFGG